MPIISVSLTGDLLEDMERLQRQGYSGRSEIVRAGLRKLFSDEQAQLYLADPGEVLGSITLIAKERVREELHRIQHRHHAIISTQIHQCLSDRRCMTIFVVEGAGTEVAEFARKLERMKDIEAVRVTLSR